ncbi:hypothetical protein BDV59DRAFT_172603 [Aspergillus ambiguus]|uniref:uncharacterized protein n=1 Tax=Aspergillus ambiguus TaxID=176160 RepID=UPI003CCCC134
MPNCPKWIESIPDGFRLCRPVSGVCKVPRRDGVCVVIIGNILLRARLDSHCAGRK